MNKTINKKNKHKYKKRKTMKSGSGSGNKDKKKKKEKESGSGSGSHEKENCSICHDILGTKIIILKCKQDNGKDTYLHKFHKKCLTDNYNYQRNLNPNIEEICPLCRKPLTYREKYELGIIKDITLDNIDSFKDFINDTLRIYTDIPLTILKDELKKFIGNESLLRILTKSDILEFKLQKIGDLGRYQFTKLVNKNKLTNSLIRVFTSTNIYLKIGKTKIYEV